MEFRPFFVLPPAFFVAEREASANNRGAVRVTAVTHHGGFEVSSCEPLELLIRGRMLVWWDTSNGELKFAFLHAPSVTLASHVALGRGLLGCLAPLVQVPRVGSNVGRPRLPFCCRG